MAIKPAINPGVGVAERPASVAGAMNFISGGAPLGTSIVASAANKIVGFQRGAAAVAPKAPDLGSIIKTLSTNILNNVENRVQSINNNVQQFVQKNFQTQLGEYRQKVASVDGDVPNRFLENFISLYKDAIGYIQFLGNRRNIKQLGDNLKALQEVFSETFQVARVIRQTIIRIVEQLSNLPKAAPGGSGIDVDVNVPGGPLRRAAPSRGGVLKMLGMAGLAGGGAVLGARVVSGMMDAGDGSQVAAVPTESGQGLSGPLLDRFSAILDRFDKAIQNLASRGGQATAAKSGTAGLTTPEPEPAAGSGAPGAPGAPGEPGAPGVTATGSEQQKTEALIAGEEGVELKAYQNKGDVPTIGYGQTRINGRAVRLGDTMTKEQATTGLRENIESHRARAIKQVGEENWKKLDENTRVVLTSVAYNYGSLPSRIMPAVKTGNSEKIAQALSLLHGDNGGILKARREREAGFIRTGTSPKLDKDFLAGGKLAAAGGVTAAAVTAAPTRANTQQQISQQVSQPPPSQSKPQVNVVPMNMSSPQAQSTPVGSQVPAPPILSKGGASVPFLTSTNHDNFLTLYSKIVYNLVD